MLGYGSLVLEEEKTISTSAPPYLPNTLGRYCWGNHPLLDPPLQDMTRLYQKVQAQVIEETIWTGLPHKWWSKKISCAIHSMYFSLHFDSSENNYSALWYFYTQDNYKLQKWCYIRNSEIAPTSSCASVPPYRTARRTHAHAAAPRSSLHLHARLQPFPSQLALFRPTPAPVSACIVQVDTRRAGSHCTASDSTISGCNAIKFRPLIRRCLELSAGLSISDSYGSVSYLSAGDLTGLCRITKQLSYFQTYNSYLFCFHI